MSICLSPKCLRTVYPKYFALVRLMAEDPKFCSVKFGEIWPTRESQVVGTAQPSLTSNDEHCSGP